MAGSGAGCKSRGRRLQTIASPALAALAIKIIRVSDCWTWKVENYHSRGLLMNCQATTLVKRNKAVTAEQPSNFGDAVCFCAGFLLSSLGLVH